MKTTIENQIKEIKAIISEHRLIADRRKAIYTEMELICMEYPMGPGGVGQVIEMKNHYRVQIGYGHGRNNYAMAVYLAK